MIDELTEDEMRKELEKPTRVVVRDMATGETTISSSKSPNFWMLSGACDCARAHLFGDVADHKKCLGSIRYIIVHCDAQIVDTVDLNMRYPAGVLRMCVILPRNGDTVPTQIITIKKRPFISRLIRVPRFWIQNYAIFRRGSGVSRREAATEATKATGRLITGNVKGIE